MLWRVAATFAFAYASVACAPSSSRAGSIADPLDAPDGIIAIGSSGDLAYFVTRNRKLRSFNLRTRELRTLDRGDVIGVARDATVALGASETVLRAFEPGSGKTIATHRFKNGIERALGVSLTTAFIVAKRPEIDWPENAAGAPPASTELVSWDFASGKVLGVGACEELGLSLDGAISLCDLGWEDRRSGKTSHPPPLAPEWAKSDPEPEEPPPGCVKCSWHELDTGTWLLSAWLSADGSSVYLTYRRTEGSEWRLDRWFADATGKTTGRVERLAASRERIGDRVLAVSRDGRTVLTNPGMRPPVLRHAPGYEGLPLLAPPVTAAAFSEDERLIVTGHGDGRLRVWEADSGWFEAISP